MCGVVYGDRSIRGRLVGCECARGEIGDKCVRSYSSVMLHGDLCVVQAIRSNRNNGCVYTL
jgi:hypothetical protein